MVTSEMTVQGVNLPTMTFTKDQVELVKRTVAKGTTDDELALFLYTAKKTGLDPLIKQIHAVKRWNTQEGREVMSIQTGIDGYRLIAERTGHYAPGREPSFEEKDGKLFSATAYVKKFVGGVWHEVAATAFWDEYVQKKKDGTTNVMWGKMPRLMLAKCAETLALRRAFPAEMSGVYTHEEMAQAEVAEVVEKPEPKDEIGPGEVTFRPVEVREKEILIKNGPRKGTTAMKFGIVHPDGRTFGTFDSNHADTGKKAIKESKDLTVLFDYDGQYYNVKDAITEVQLEK